MYVQAIYVFTAWGGGGDAYLDDLPDEKQTQNNMHSEEDSNYVFLVQRCIWSVVSQAAGNLHIRHETNFIKFSSLWRVL